MLGKHGYRLSNGPMASSAQAGRRSQHVLSQRPHFETSHFVSKQGGRDVLTPGRDKYSLFGSLLFCLHPAMRVNCKVLVIVTQLSAGGRSVDNDACESG
jgi:hypothetical protein